MSASAGPQKKHPPLKVLTPLKELQVWSTFRSLDSYSEEDSAATPEGGGKATRRSWVQTCSPQVKLSSVFNKKRTPPACLPDPNEDNNSIRKAHQDFVNLLLEFSFPSQFCEEKKRRPNKRNFTTVATLSSSQ